MDLDSIEYLSKVWYVPGPKRDWLAWLYRAPGDRRWRFDYRFRYYAGSRDRFDGNDRKSFYQSVDDANRTEAELVASVEILVGLISRQFGGTADRVEVQGPPMMLLEKGADRPWLHVKWVPLS